MANREMQEYDEYTTANRPGHRSRTRARWQLDEPEIVDFEGGGRYMQQSGRVSMDHFAVTYDRPATRPTKWDGLPLFVATVVVGFLVVTLYKHYVVNGQIPD